MSHQPKEPHKPQKAAESAHMVSFFIGGGGSVYGTIAGMTALNVPACILVVAVIVAFFGGWNLLFMCSSRFFAGSWTAYHNRLEDAGMSLGGFPK